MGIFHVYCALCGGPTIMDQDPWVDEYAGSSDDEDKDNDAPIPRLDPELVTEESIAWISRMRIVGLNKESNSGRKCFISGEGTCDDTGVFFAFDRSDDPVFPTDQQCLVNPGNVPEFRVCTETKSWPEDGNFYCFHDACFEVLKEMAAGRLGDRDNDRDDLDATLLYSFFRYLYSRSYEKPEISPLNDPELPYIENETEYEYGPRGQFWEWRRGEEVWASDPFNIPELQEYYENLPRFPGTGQKTKQELESKVGEYSEVDHTRGLQHDLCQERQKIVSQHQDSSQPVLLDDTSDDPLEKLPNEVLLEVLIYLPAQSIVNLKISSPAARRLQLSNWFWWHRVRSAMPFLWDLPGFHGPTGSEQIDWHQAYVDLTTRGRGHGHGKILGLVNRHRMWPEGVLASWFKNKAGAANEDVEDAISEWGDHQSFRAWRDARGQTMSGKSLE